MAEFQLAMSAFLESPAKSYDMILDLDSRLQEIVGTLPTTNYSANGHNKPVCERLVKWAAASFCRVIIELTQPCLYRPNDCHMYALEQSKLSLQTSTSCVFDIKASLQVVRLHRPFLIKGLESPTSKYAYSAKICIGSARTMCDSLDNGAESDMVMFWFTYGQVLGAVICIFSKFYRHNPKEMIIQLCADLLSQTVEHLFRGKSHPKARSPPAY
jgi:hypothetical protein